MAKPYSMDLRDRVVMAVIEEGMSCHAAASRFGVAISSAIKWVERYRETGSAAPKRMGGCKPNILSGAARDWLLERVTRDFTLRGLVSELGARCESGLRTGVALRARRRTELQKKRAARRTAPPGNRAAPGAVEEISGSA